MNKNKIFFVCIVGVVLLYVRSAFALTLSINSGSAYTNSFYTTLSIGGRSTDANWMIFSNDNYSWSSWESISSTKNNWDLTSYGGGDNNKAIVIHASYSEWGDCVC